MQKVFVIHGGEVRQAGLIGHVTLRGKLRCKVRLRGARSLRWANPALVFHDLASARQAMRRARAHRADFERTGRHLTVTAAVLDLAGQVGGLHDHAA